MTTIRKSDPERTIRASELSDNAWLVTRSGNYMAVTRATTRGSLTMLTINGHKLTIPASAPITIKGG